MSMPHPEDLDRPMGSYDPDEPLLVRYADVIAARNAVGLWISSLDAKPGGELSEYQRWVLRTHLAAGVDADPRSRGEFASDEELLEWLEALRQRLKNAFPEPASWK